MKHALLKPEIIADIKRVAQELGTSKLGKREYFGKGFYSAYRIYEGGTTWEQYCHAAGIQPKTKEAVTDEAYFNNLVQAVKALGRLPKSSERKRFGLNFTKIRYPTLSSFIDRAVERGYVERPSAAFAQPGAAPETAETTRATDHGGELPTNRAPTEGRAIPPIPAQTRRRRWERTGIEGFPYAPQDESGVVALFAILCARQAIDWEILELRAGKGIDATCYDHRAQREIRVELKHTLSRTGWQHRIQDVDYVVCWENHWRDFPKPVIELRSLVKVRQG